VRKLLFLLYWVCGYQTLHAQFQLVTQALDQLGQQTPYAKADISFTLLDNQAYPINQTVYSRLHLP
jgi:hypothetical protein